MEEVIREYGAAIIAACANFSLIAVLGQILMSRDGMLLSLILMWL